MTTPLPDPLTDDELAAEIARIDREVQRAIDMSVARFLVRKASELAATPAPAQEQAA